MKKSHMLLSCSLVVLLALPGFAHAFGDEIVVGFMVPLTKKGASYGVQSRAATEVAVEEINAAGGIGGRKLTVITKDTVRFASAPKSSVFHRPRPNQVCPHPTRGPSATPWMRTF